MTTRGSPRRPLVLLSTLAGALALMAGCNSHDPSAPEVPLAPIATSFSASANAWGIVPMGELGNRDNTFWQLVVARVGSPRIRVVTPPGVADNGGLVADAGFVMSGNGLRPATVVGVLTNDLLGFSPLAASSDLGRSWSPASLPGPLARTPGSFALGGRAGAAALVGKNGRFVYWSSAGLATWRRVTSLPALSGASPRCRPRALTDASFDTARAEYLDVAGACGQPGQVGFYLVTRSGAVRDLGGAVTGLRHDRFEPLAVSYNDLLGGPAARVPGFIVLGLAESARHESVVEIASDGLHRWGVISRLVVPPAYRLLAFGSVPSFALIGTGPVRGPRHERLYELAGPAARLWRLVARPPAGTESLLFDGRAATALVVRRSVLRAERRTPRGWNEVYRVKLPIEYGSSS